MRRAVKLYVSSGRDLARERDGIGRLVAELPVTAGWEIGATPLAGQRMPSASASAGPAGCDLYIFLLGQDITAPAGSEWDAAQRTGRPTLALLKDVARTPAGQQFQRYVQEPWVRFRSLEELEQAVRPWLIRQLVDRAEELRLTLAELEQLAALAQTPEADKASLPPTERPGGAGGSGVILPSPPGGG